MARFLESGLWADIKKEIPGIDQITHAERVETRFGGFPDVLFNSIPGGAFLVELKLGEILASGKIKFKFRDDQPLWHYLWTKHGGRSYIIAKLASPARYLLFWGGDCEKIKHAITRAATDDLALLQSDNVCDILNFILPHEPRTIHYVK